MSQSLNSEGGLDVDLGLHNKQGKVLNSNATEMLYGGAAGGGKSHLMRVLAIMLCLMVPGLQVYIFRRHYGDLYKNHMEGPSSFLVLLASMLNTGLCKYNSSKNTFTFWNKAVIHLCHLQYEKDLIQYQGAEIHVLLMDELTHFTEKMYRFLRGRVRMIGIVVPDIDLVPGVKLRSRLPMILGGSNPGGIGHNWVKRTFVDMCQNLAVVKCDKKEGGMLRQFIPALVEDNPSLMIDDPDYLDKLEGLGDPALVKAMRTGDWNIVAGGALDDVWTPKIILPRFRVPADWIVDRSFDWGSSHPFSVGWWCEATGEEIELEDGTTFTPAAGSLIRIAEWYGTKALGSNEGIKLSAPEIAAGIVEREKILKEEKWISSDVRAGPADGQIYDIKESDVDTIAKKMSDKPYRIRWTRANKAPGTRIIGLELVRTRFKAVAKGEGAGLYFTVNCPAAIATLPTLPRDEKRTEDVDTKAEDHVYDDVRYKCLASGSRMATRMKIGLPT